MLKQKSNIIIGFLSFIIIFMCLIFNSNITVSAESNLIDIELGEIHGNHVNGNLEDGFIVDRISGSNNMAVFNTRTTVMEFEADMEVLQGQAAAGLMFGVKDLLASNGEWSAMHIQPGANAFRVFCEKNWSQTGGFDSGVVSLPSGTASSKMHLKISINSNDLIKVYVNDMSNPCYTSTLVDYCGGYVGIMTYDTKVKITNLKLQGIKVPSITNLELVGAELEEQYDKDLYDYTSFVDASTKFVKVKVTLDEGKYVVNNKKYESGQESSSISLLKDVNTIQIGVQVDKESINIITITVVREYNKENAYTETYRPQFHYTQQRFWANDPNGLIYNSYTQEYHMFYQYNPTAYFNDGNHHWGHAVSKDLVHWVEHPIALYPDGIGRIASGSAVIDYNNTSGLFSEETPKESRMVMIYTYFANASSTDNGGSQKQAITYSEDNGYTWKKYSGNPVIPNTNNQYDIDFRDPKVIWIEETNEWLMVVAGGKARIFTSPNLIDWTYNCNLTYLDGSQIISECPDLFPLALDNNQENIKWVYTGSGLFYVVGDLVKENGKYIFKTETEKRDLFVNASYGWAMYATQSFSNIIDGRRILVSWMPSYDATGYTVDGRLWNSSQSIPLEAKLITVNGEMCLTVNPIKEIETLRKEIIYSKNNITVDENSGNILSGIKGHLLDIEASFKVNDATEFGFYLRNATNDGVIVKYSVTNQELTVDSTETTAAVHGVTKRLVALLNNTLTLRILVDTSIIDVFANNGLASINQLYNTNPTADGMKFYTIGGSVVIDSIKIYSMNSSWLKEDMVDTSPLLLNLEVSDASLNSTFNPFINEYNIVTSHKTIIITPEAALSNTIVIRINGKQVKNGENETINLNTGMNTIIITVRDQVGKRTYILNVECLASDQPNKNHIALYFCIGGAIIIGAIGMFVFLRKKKTIAN